MSEYIFRSIPLGLKEKGRQYAPFHKLNIRIINLT